MDPVDDQCNCGGHLGHTSCETSAILDENALESSSSLLKKILTSRHHQRGHARSNSVSIDDSAAMWPDRLHLKETFSTPNSPLLNNIHRQMQRSRNIPTGQDTSPRLQNNGHCNSLNNVNDVVTAVHKIAKPKKSLSLFPLRRSRSKPLSSGSVFLSFRDEMKRVSLPANLSSMLSVENIFYQAFPHILSYQWFQDCPSRKIYIQDMKNKDIFYELEDVHDVKPNSVLKIHEPLESDISPYDASRSGSLKRMYIAEYPTQSDIMQHCTCSLSHDSLPVQGDFPSSNNEKYSQNCESLKSSRDVSPLSRWVQEATKTYDGHREVASSTSSNSPASLTQAPDGVLQVCTYSSRKVECTAASSETSQDSAISAKSMSSATSTETAIQKKALSCNARTVKTLQFQVQNLKQILSNLRTCQRTMSAGMLETFKQHKAAVKAFKRPETSYAPEDATLAKACMEYKQQLREIDTLISNLEVCIKEDHVRQHSTSDGTNYFFACLDERFRIVESMISKSDVLCKTEIEIPIKAKIGEYNKSIIALQRMVHGVHDWKSVTSRRWEKLETARQTLVNQRQGRSEEKSSASQVAVHQMDKSKDSAIENGNDEKSVKESHFEGLHKAETQSASSIPVSIGDFTYPKEGSRTRHFSLGSARDVQREGFLQQRATLSGKPQHPRLQVVFSELVKVEDGSETRKLNGSQETDKAMTAASEKEESQLADIVPTTLDEESEIWEPQTEFNTLTKTKDA